MMKKLAVSLIVLLILILASSCNSDCPPPVTEVCVIRTNDLYCINKNLPDDRQKYYKDFWDAKKYIALSPNAYEKYKAAWDKLCKKSQDCN